MKKATIIIIFLITFLLITPIAGQTTPTQVTTNDYIDRDPQIAADSSGNSYLTWRGYEGGNDGEIFWAKVDSSDTVTYTTQVTTNDYSDEDPQIAADSSGNSYLTWRGHDGNDYEIFWAKVDSSGAFTTVQVTTNSYHEYYPQIAIDSSGNSYLTWYGEDGDAEIFWAKVDSSDTVTDTTQVTDNSYADESSQIAADPSGNSYLTWWGEEGGNDREIFFVKMAGPAVPRNPINLFAIFKPIANTQLANANTMWNCIAENLPEEVPEEV